MTRLFASLAALALLLVGTAAHAADEVPTNIEEGVDWIEITGGAPFDPQPGKIEVVEFFNYICPACFGFEPKLESWKARMPEDVNLVLIPAPFRPDFELYAKVYYAAKQLGVEEKSHGPIYAAIHVAHTLPDEGDRPTPDSPAAVGKIADFYAGYGIDAATFTKTLYSFSVDTQVRRANQYTARSKVRATPTLMVAGRYQILSRDPDRRLQTLDYLVDKVRQASAP